MIGKNTITELNCYGDIVLKYSIPLDELAMRKKILIEQAAMYLN